jgi:hypothetical protein
MHSVDAGATTRYNTPWENRHWDFFIFHRSIAMKMPSDKETNWLYGWLTFKTSYTITEENVSNWLMQGVWILNCYRVHPILTNILLNLHGEIHRVCGRILMYSMECVRALGEILEIGWWAHANKKTLPGMIVDCEVRFLQAGRGIEILRVKFKPRDTPKIPRAYPYE